MQRALVIIGLFFLAIGILWPVFGKVPLGRLPGDIIIDRPNFKVFFPITTMVILSLVLSFLFWLMRK